MVTAAEHNDLASLVLGTGRTLFALVSDPTKKSKVVKEVGLACLSAMKHGWFAELSQPDVRVGGVTLPMSVPEHNIPGAVESSLIEAVGAYDEIDDEDIFAGACEDSGR